MTVHSWLSKKGESTVLSNRAIHKAILVFSFGLALAACSQSSPQNGQVQEKPVPVQVASIQKGSLSQKQEIYGVASANAEANVMPKMNGELTKLDVQVNQFVEKGASLGVIDHESLQIQVKMERFALEQALEQYRDLSRAGAGQKELDQASRGVEQAKLRVQLAEINVGNAYMKSPISGHVVSVNAKQGEFVSAGGPLFRIVSMDPVKISANVNAAQMLQFREQQQIPVSIPDLGKSFTAKITHLAQVANEAGFYKVEAELPNPDTGIKPGMTAVFVIEHELVKDAMLVPTKAIVEKGGASTVFIVSDGKAVEKRVEVIEAQSELTAITGELSEQDRVVVKGQLSISDGKQVNLVEGAQ